MSLWNYVYYIIFYTGLHEGIYFVQTVKTKGYIKHKTIYIYIYYYVHCSKIYNIIYMVYLRVYVLYFIWNYIIIYVPM